MKKKLLELCIAILIPFSGVSCSTDSNPTNPVTNGMGTVRDESGNGVTVRQEEGMLLMATKRAFVRYDLIAGLFSAGRHDREPVLENAFLEVRSALGSKGILSRSTKGYGISWESEDADTPLGKGKRVTISLAGIQGLPDLEQSFTLLSGFDPILLSGGVINHTGRTIRVGVISPAIADKGSRGGLRIGKDSTSLRILENGFAGVIDFYCRLEPGNIGTLSNWNSAIHDRSTHENMVFGALTFENAEPLIVTKPRENGRHTLAFRPHNTLNPPLRLAEGERIDTEIYYLDLCASNPLDGLEAYATAIKDWQGIRLWTERHPEIGVPNGWNSWSGSGRSGGYGSGINEAIIMDNLDVMDREFRKWGIRFFQIDDGWQVAEGDWEVRKDRFPDREGKNGIEWILDQARQRGFHTGIWISPYNALESSRLVAEHPEWFAEKDLIGFLSVNEDMKILDITHPEVQEWLAHLMSTLKGWGCAWIKLDFGYWFLMSKDWYQKNITRVNGHRQGQKIVKDILGPDMFFLSVSVMGPNYGIVDGDRITLDTMPVWDGEKGGELDIFTQLDNQGIKPSVRTIQRRYYLHQRVWIQHPDLIFFRAHADPQYPPLTLVESRTLCQLVAYSGGIVKIGEKLVDMSGEAVATVRKILPVHGACGRPLDLFEREFAEVWSLAVPDFDEPYHTVGLFNWGLNLDLTENPYAEMPDMDREIRVSLEEAGMDPDTSYLAYEFWGQRFLGEFKDSLVLQVPKHASFSVALREKLGRPQFLGINRHVLGGVKVVDSLTWNEGTGELTGVQEGSVGTAHAPFAFHLAFYVPQGYTFDHMRFQAPEGVSVENAETGLTPLETGTLLDLGFTVRDTNGEQPGEPFQRISWTLSFSR